MKKLYSCLMFLLCMPVFSCALPDLPSLKTVKVMVGKVPGGSFCLQKVENGCTAVVEKVLPVVDAGMVMVALMIGLSRHRSKHAA